jgi:hypothetical protein
VHSTLEAGNDGPGEVDWTKVEHLVETTSTPFIHLHLDSKQKYFPDF